MPTTYTTYSVRELKTLRDQVNDAIKDESAAVPMYDDMAKRANSIGAPNIAKTIRQIRDQEMAHYETFIEINKSIEQEIQRRGGNGYRP